MQRELVFGPTWAAVAFASCALLASCAANETTTAESDDAIFGTTTTNVDTVATGFEAAVGRIFIGASRRCTATLISRTAILTARHCFCAGQVPSDVTFCLPQLGSGDRCFSLNNDEGFTAGGSAAFSHLPFNVWDTCNTPDLSFPGPDVLTIVLGTPVPVTVVPEIPKVYLGDSVFSFAETESANYGGTPTYFAVGFGGTSWGSPFGGGVRRRGEIGSDLRYEDEDDTFDSWFLEADANDDPAALATVSKGDSGGPLIMQPMVNGQRVGHAYIVGVASLISDIAWDDDQHWAVTGNTLQGSDSASPVANSDLILAALEPDGDSDGVIDNLDNCPPSACTTDNVTSCWNEDQEDADGDGAGDACDRCDDYDDTIIFGVPGADSDSDGFGDACDSCPHTPTSYQSDQDHDGVGDACDNCKDTPNAYATCTLDSDCPSGLCVHTHGLSPGRCSTQSDDGDGDGSGDACDICRDNPANGIYGITANSNADREMIEGASLLGDPCDPVPHYVVRPNLHPFEQPNAICSDGGAGELCKNVAKLFASATLGSPNGALNTFTAPVGFRHCDCYDGSETLLDRETCLATRCAILPTDYSSPVSAYRRISVGVAGAGVPNYPASQSASTFSSRTFNSNIADVDHYDHPDDQLDGDVELETHRVGPTELLSWAWKRDISLGNITGHPSAAPLANRGTGGIFWSLAMPTHGSSSPRDVATGQRLRSTYTYFTTPLIAPPKPIYYSPIVMNGCISADCYLIERPGIAQINPQDLHQIVRIHENLGSAVMSADRSFQPMIADGVLSPAMRAELLNGRTRWLSPVESDRVSRTLDSELAGAYLPVEWDASSSVHIYSYEHGAFSESSIPMLGAARPSARTGFGAVLSIAERALWLVGGESTFGYSTHEIWRLDLETGLWSEHNLSGGALERVVDVAYAPQHRRMVAIDREEVGGRSMIRIVQLDFAAQKKRVLAEYSDSGRFEHISIAAEDSGSFVLLLSEAARDRVDAYRFEVGRSGINWLGEGWYSGTLIDGAQIAGDGVVAPMFSGGTTSMPVILATDLQNRSTGPAGF